MRWRVTKVATKSIDDECTIISAHVDARTGWIGQPRARPLRGIPHVLVPTLATSDSNGRYGTAVRWLAAVCTRLHAVLTAGWRRAHVSTTSSSVESVAASVLIVSLVVGPLEDLTPQSQSLGTLAVKHDEFFGLTRLPRVDEDAE